MRGSRSEPSCVSYCERSDQPFWKLPAAKRRAAKLLDAENKSHSGVTHTNARLSCVSSIASQASNPMKFPAVAVAKLLDAKKVNPTPV